MTPEVVYEEELRWEILDDVSRRRFLRVVKLEFSYSRLTGAADTRGVAMCMLGCEKVEAMDYLS